MARCSSHDMRALSHHRYAGFDKGSKALPPAVVGVAALVEHFACDQYEREVAQNRLMIASFPSRERVFWMAVSTQTSTTKERSMNRGRKRPPDNR